MTLLNVGLMLLLLSLCLLTMINEVRSLKEEGEDGPSVPKLIEITEETEITQEANDNNSDNNLNINEDILINNITLIIDKSNKMNKNKKNQYKSKFINYITTRKEKKEEYNNLIKMKNDNKIESKFELYIASDEYINILNNNLTKPIYNHTKFSDWSLEEKKSILMNDKEYEEYKRRMLISCYSFAGWGSGVVTTSSNFKSLSQPVQDQGSCGSCWAFASLSQYELNYRRYKGISQKQSEQYLLDCGVYGDCGGGGVVRTNLWLGTYGSCPQSSYFSYDAKDIWSCQSCKTSLTPISNVACMTKESTGYEGTSYEKWKVITNAALNVGLSFSMSISNNFYYLSGDNVYLYECDNSHLVGIHAMSIYGTNGLSVYVKNSWGTDWGSNGWFSMYYTARTSCLLNDYVTFNYW